MASILPCRLVTSHHAAAASCKHHLRSSSTTSSLSSQAILGSYSSRRTLSTSPLTQAPLPPPPPPPQQQQQQRCRQSSSLFLRTPKSRFQPPSSLRKYHSYDHPPTEPESFSPTERAILIAAYAHIPSHGFSREALALGARDAGFLDISTNLLPDGVFSLVKWHLVSQREALAGQTRDLFAGEEGERLGLGMKVEMLTWERLIGNRMVIQRWQEALAIMAQPSYVPTSLQELAKLADEIWFLVGDKSVDPSWYTKRASLSAIYASTELFMTTDTSEGFIETRKFLRRRLAEVHEVGGTLRSMGQWVGFTVSAGLNVLRSKGMRI